MSQTARAQDSEDTIPWVSFSYGGGTYAMENVNTDIHNVERQAGIPFDEITSGYGFDIGVGMDVGSFFRLGLHFQRIQAESSLSDGVATLEYRYPASAIYVGMAAMRPATSRLKYGIEIGLGLTLSSGEAELSGAGLFDAKSELGGTGPYFAARGIFDIKITGMLAFSTGVGYRYAATHEMSADGIPITDNDGLPFSIDYSGFEAQAGIRFFFVRN